MKREAVADIIGNDVLFADGFDDAIIGYVERFGQEPIVLYDRNKVIKTLAKDMPVSDAEEYFEFNVIGAWVGDKTPAFATIIKK